MYKLVVAGGTFDLLHKGHKSFLTQILAQADRLILGLTTDSYVLANKGNNFENYETRKKNLENFLSSFKNKVEIIPIDDIYGPLLSKKINPDAIAVTHDTSSSIEKINSKRLELELNPLKSIVALMDLAEDGVEISSSRIRNGEIDREGKLYLKTSWKGKNFNLPDSLRTELQKPFGQIGNDIPDNLDRSRIITVGDVTTKLFNENKINQFLSIVDFKVNREKKFYSVKDLGFEAYIKIFKIISPRGIISYELIEVIRESFENKVRTVVLIDGEDDLAVLPCLLASPLGYSIFYGQPNKGLVWVKVTEENKEKVYRLLSQFLIS